MRDPPRSTIAAVTEASDSESSCDEYGRYSWPTTPRPYKSSVGLMREAYEQRIAEIERLLEPLTSEDEEAGKTPASYDDGFVFLCWGDTTNCRVLRVKHFQADMDHELFWKRLQKTWFQMRGQWRRKLPWYAIRNVRMVDVRLVGPVPDRPGLYHGTYRLLDDELEAKKESLRRKIKPFKDEIERKSREQRIQHLVDYGEDAEFSFEPDWEDDSDYSDDVERCTYDEKLGLTRHGLACCTLEENEDCDAGEPFVSENVLNGLMMEPLRASLLRNPHLAVYHNLSNKELVHIKR
ncbi:hypothetical protein DL767_003890 [Monosporascus sp. MG133]|nr:hypothetical protein DL767_003890 [Monosporascus sp. MG133]